VHLKRNRPVRDHNDTFKKNLSCVLPFATLFDLPLACHSDSFSVLICIFATFQNFFEDAEKQLDNWFARSIVLAVFVKEKVDKKGANNIGEEERVCFRH